MAHRVEIASGYNGVALPDNNRPYDAGDVVTLTDEQWALVNQDLIGTVLIDRGAVGPSLDESGTLPEEEIPASIARDAEITSAISTAVAALVNSAPSVLDTLGEIATALQADESAAAALTTTVAGKVPLSTVTTKGDLLAATGSATVARLGVGSDGQALVADSTQATGLKWSTVGAASPLTLTAANANELPLVVKGAAAQAVNLQEWRASNNSVVGQLTPSGSLALSGVIQAGTYFSAAGGKTLLGLSGFQVAHFMQSGAAGDVVLNVRGFTSQSADLVQFQTDTGTVLAKVRVTGEYENFVAGNPASDAGGGTGGMVLKSPNGTRYRVTVANDGSLTTTAA